MDIQTYLTDLATLIHQHVAIVSVAVTVAILGMLYGDIVEFLNEGLTNGWKSVLSLNALVRIVSNDAATRVVGGAVLAAVVTTLAAGGSLRDAGLAGLAAIAAVNVGLLFGQDRALTTTLLGLLAKRLYKPAPPVVTPLPLTTVTVGPPSVSGPPVAPVATIDSEPVRLPIPIGEMPEDTSIVPGKPNRPF